MGFGDMGVELGMGRSKFSKVGSGSRLQAQSAFSRKAKLSTVTDSSGLKESEMSMEESLTVSQTKDWTAGLNSSPQLSKDSEQSRISKKSKVIHAL